MWKKFCAHKTFSELLDSTLSMLEKRFGSSKLGKSVWIEGAYGTGKSYASLTMLKLFDATEDECKGYFDEYSDVLNSDLLNRLLGVKTQKKMLTVFRSGSSSISGDKNLCFDIQESVLAALKAHGMDGGASGLREAALQWLKQEWAHDAVQKLIDTDYTALFNGHNADDIIKELESEDGSAGEMVTKLMTLGQENGFTALCLDANKIAAWLRKVMEVNALDAIVLVWDEFTEYFRNNSHNMTGFQQLSEMVTESRQFCLVPITHNVWNLLDDAGQDIKKVRDRFKQCRIELPDGMAVRLMAHAMRHTRDEKDASDWNNITADLASGTRAARTYLCGKTHIDDSDMQKVLPVHPFAAVMLSHIASAFGSNQRSMFQFINNNDNDMKGFLYFINNHDPFAADGVLLTVDMLWDFFYEHSGEDELSPAILSVLNSASRARSASLSAEETRVLHTVLLMQAVSQGARDTIEFFVPNEKNLDLSFEGVVNMGAGTAKTLAIRLCEKGLLCRAPLAGGGERFSAMITSADGARLENEKKKLMDAKRTSDLIGESALKEAFTLTDFAAERFEVDVVEWDDIRRAVQKHLSAWKIHVVIAVAKDDMEGDKVVSSINAVLPSCDESVILVDASSSPLGMKEFASYAESQAGANIYLHIDRVTSQGHERNAKATLNRWRDRVKGGKFIVWRNTDGNSESEQAVGADALIGRLVSIDKNIYPDGLETGQSVNSTMWKANQLALGVDCGAGQTLSSSYKSSNAATSLNTFIGENVWGMKGGVPYWDMYPTLLISRIKRHLDTVVLNGLKDGGRVNVLHLYQTLMEKPYGFMPCNLSAFVLGFALKEYCTGEYRWSDKNVGGELNIDKLKEMVSEAIKEVASPAKHFHEQYIAKRTVEERAFDEATHKIFAIETEGASMEMVRNSICTALKGLSFPLWTVKYSPNASGNMDVKRLVDYYCQLVNPANGSGTEYSNIVQDMGKMLRARPAIADVSARFINVDNCIEGMKAYLAQFNEGEIMRLASEIGADIGRVLEDVRSKFNSGESKWLWSKETGDEQIEQVAVEYSIVAKSNKLNPPAKSFSEVLDVWQERCNHLHISCAVVKDSVDSSLAGLLDALCSMITMGGSSVMRDCLRCRQLLDLIKGGGTAFRDFYTDPITPFKTSCDYYLRPHGFTDNEVRDIYNKLSDGSFTHSKQQYLNEVEKAVTQFVCDRAGDKLKALWKEMTGTTSPVAWAVQYQMPVSCLFPKGHTAQAAEAVKTANESHPGKEESERAMDFFASSDARAMFDNMQNAVVRDKCFCDAILGTYSTILTDAKAVRDYLTNALSVPPAEWMGNTDVARCVENMAKAKYDQGGVNVALKKIDNMPSEKVKDYLKHLITTNMKVGIEIINTKDGSAQ